MMEMVKIKELSNDELKKYLKAYEELIYKDPSYEEKIYLIKEALAQRQLLKPKSKKSLFQFLKRNN